MYFFGNVNFENDYFSLYLKEIEMIFELMWVLFIGIIFYKFFKL